MPAAAAAQSIPHLRQGPHIVPRLAHEVPVLGYPMRGEARGGPQATHHSPLAVPILQSRVNSATRFPSGQPLAHTQTHPCSCLWALQGDPLIRDSSHAL